MKRRTLLQLPMGALALAAERFPFEDLRRRRGVEELPSGLLLSREFTGEVCRSRLRNPGKTGVRPREVVLFSIRHQLPAATALYGESFQMLSQTGGTLANPVPLGYDERKHYRIPQPEQVTALSGMMLLSPAPGEHTLLGFASCRRFNGRFYLRPGVIDVVLDTEDLELAPGESWELEEFFFAGGPSRPLLLGRLAAHLNRNHPRLAFPAPPTGWCSWYCFGPRVTAAQVLANLDTIATRIPGLKYVQIDDGYQPAMGDWLETGKAFGGDVQGVLKAIRQRGFEPAIWVAPFIAESGSNLFKRHPDWFMKDETGAPLPSSKVTFPGWRRGPWYALDGTHPGVQKHLEQLFRTMRNDWGVSYFKLDANFWGAMHGGRLHDPKATRIEAYRRGMQAVLRGAGNSFILGCNHPIWPSLGLIHGSRSSGDIKRTWETIRKVARQNLMRNWQNGKLWWNDSDAVVLAGSLPLNEFLFHATAVYASGGLILSGDDLSTMPADRMEILRKLLPPTGKAAVFEDDSLRVGTVDLGARRMICLLNWSDGPQDFAPGVPEGMRVHDLWSGAPVANVKNITLPGRTGTVLSCVQGA